MIGKVKGLPKAVPMAAASIEPRVKKARTNPKMKWKPTKGKTETAAPEAMPAATAWPLARSRWVRRAR